MKLLSKPSALLLTFILFLSGVSSTPAAFVRAQASGSSSEAGGFTGATASPSSNVDASTTISGTAVGGEETTAQGQECPPPKVEDPSITPGTLSAGAYSLDGSPSQSFSLQITQVGTSHIGGGCADSGHGTYQPYEYSFSFTVNTSALSNGAHTAVLTAEDGATQLPVQTSASFTVQHIGCSPNCVPKVTLTASAPTVASGGTVDMTWTTQDSPDSCSASSTDNVWGGSKSPGGGTETGVGPLNNPPNASYSFTITCTKGSLSAQSSTTVTVSQASSDFSLSCTPATTSINAGDSTAYSVSVSPIGGFTGSVSLSASGVPSPAQSAFSTNPISGGAGSSALSISNTASLSPGTYTISVTGTSSTLSHSCTVQLVVNSPGSYTLSVSKNGTGSGTVTSGDNSISCGATCSASYPTGTVVTLTATSTGGGSFAGWTGDCSGNSASCQVTMDSAKSVTATFSAPGAGHILTISTAGTGSGIVGSGPAGINCPSTCSSSFSTGTVVTLTATANTGSVFAGWSGSCNGTGQCTLTMNSDLSATATFNTAPSYNLSVSKSGSGIGTVTSSPSGINCGSTCTASFGSGTVVTLTPAAGTNSVFSSWGGACSGSATCAVTMSAAKSVTATFTSSSGAQTLSVTLAGTGSGSVTSDSPGISCQPSCSANYASGSTITLTATPAVGSVFTSWSANCATGNGGPNVCQVTLGSFTSVTATFTLSPGFTLTCTPALENVGQGTSTAYGITVNPAGGFTGTVSLALLTVNPATPTITSSGASSASPYTAQPFPVSTTVATPANTYTLTIKGTSGTVNNTCMVSLTVTSALAPTASLTVNRTHSPSAVADNSTVTLGWTSNNVNSCTVTSSPNIGSWGRVLSTDPPSLSQDDPPGITTPALTTTTTFNLNCSGGGGNASDQVTVTVQLGDPMSVANYNTSLSPSVSCSTVQISWVAGSGDQSFYVLRSPTATDNNPSDAVQIKDFGNPPSPFNPTSYTYTPAGGAGYYYFVQAYGSGGLLSNRVLASNFAPIAPTSCSTQAPPSDKDIVSINGVGNTSVSACDYPTLDAITVPGLKLVKAGDTVTFQFNVCNTTGTAPLNDLTVTDTLVNLTPVGGYSYTGACAGSPNPAQTGSGGNYTLTFTFGGSFNLAAGSACSVSYSATVTTPTPNDQAFQHFQNLAEIKGNDGGNGNNLDFIRKTPQVIFDTGKYTGGSRHEAAP